MTGPKTAEDVLALLRRHYLPEGRPPSGLFAPEIESPNGRRRADLIWMPTALAAGTGIHGHEIKVSRADVLTELADPTKADPWARCCTRWWLVVSDPALIDGLNIPDAWGIMSPPSGRRTRSMTVLRPAPPLEPNVDRVAAGYQRLATWAAYRLHNTGQRLARETEEVGRLHRQVMRMATEAQVTSVGSPHAQRISGIITEAERRAGSAGIYERLDDATVIAALVDATATRDAARRTRWAIESLQRTLGELRDPLAEVTKPLSRAARLGLAEVQEAAAPLGKAP